MGRLNGKIAIITGAARGMGEAMARLFASEGARVVLADILAEQGHAVARDIGEHASFMPMDVSEEEDWHRLVQHAIARWQTIDVLVNNAAVAHYQPIAETSKADFQRVLDINVLGTFLGMKAVIPTMKAARRGSIVNISSLNAMRGSAELIAYDASKWAVRGMTKSAAIELAQYRIRCNSVHPGAVDTQMSNPDQAITSEEMAHGLNLPFGRVGEPIEIANAASFLASDEASYINGAEILVDGAWGAGISTHSKAVGDTARSSG